MKKAIGSAVMIILLLSIVGFRLYRKYEREQYQNSLKDQNKVLYQQIQEMQRKTKQEALRVADSIRTDSILKELEETRKKREAQFQQMRDAVKKMKQEGQATKQ